MTGTRGDDMTARDRIREKKANVDRCLIDCGVAAAVGAALTFLVHPVFLVVVLSMLAGAYVALGCGHFIAFRCPGCGANWAPFVAGPDWNRPADVLKFADLKCCPSCGLDLDAKDAAKPKPDEVDLIA